VFIDLLMHKEVMQQEARVWLQNELSTRLRLNPRYSIRSFAKKLEIHSSTLSQILSGKRHISEKMIARFEKRIGSPFFKGEASPGNYALISGDVFAIVSDWYHYSILELTHLKGFKTDIGWISRKLGISAGECQIAVDRLKRAGLLVQQGNTLRKAVSNYVNYEDGQTSEALREFQRQVIRKALMAVEGCPPERKDITSITIAADSRKLKEAREMIKKFRRQLCAFLERGEADSVYHMAIQLYPVTDSD